jgi:hypothetical protein
MNRLLSFLGALVVLALAACDGATAPDLTGDPLGVGAAGAALSESERGPTDGLWPVHLSLRLGQTQTYGESASSLTFDAVATDSRCPANLDCKHAGQARASFTFRRGDGAEYAVELAIPGGSPLELSPEDVRPAFVAGYAFRLVRLQPYPGYAPDHAPSTGLAERGTATVVIEPCTTRCFEIYPRPDQP